MDKHKFVIGASEMSREVASFHERWPQLARLPEPLEEVVGETANILDEEVQELKAELVDGSADMEAVCEEAADVLFVAMGLIYRLGEPGARALRRVTAKNEAKTNTAYFYDPARRKVRRKPPS